ncbi:MAG: PDZ domain-containing protein, partial [Parachlamydia sp.]|nr:PDZ domain-containing protein [Parachlamydia sp.]
MKNLFLFFSICSLNLLFSQSLQRKVQFGARVEYVTENGTSGCKVKQVARGTSVALKLLEKDLIVKIGNSTFASTDEFSQKFLTYSPNQEVQLTVLRGKKKLVLKAKAAARPYETDDNATVIYDEVAYKGGQLRVIINKPFKENKMPAMLFIPGYTCSSIDDLPNYHPYKRIVDAYVDAGYVTLRVEKSGLGDSKNTPPCESCDLLDEIENFEVGLKKLKSLPYVDPNQIIIVGHSMGGIVAPAISAKNKVAGVVVYGTTAKSWFEYQ